MVAITSTVALALLDAVHNPDYRVGAVALDRIAVPSDSSVIEVLIEVLHNRQYASVQNDVRTGVLAWRAVCAFGRIGDASVVPYLLAAAVEEFSLLRASVIQSLVQIATRSGDPDVRRVIVRYLIEQQTDHGVVSNFKPWQVSDEAARGLEALGIITTICVS